MKTYREYRFLKFLFVSALICLAAGCAKPIPDTPPPTPATAQSRPEKTDEELVADAIEKLQKASSSGMGAGIIKRMGPRAQSATPFLITLLQRHEWMISEQAAKALGYIGPPAEAAIPALIEALGNANFPLRRQSALALGKIGPKAIPALVEALKNENPTRRCKATDALAAMGSEAVAAVPALITSLKDQDSAVRCSAAQALGNIGPGAIDALSVLRDTMQGENIQVAVRAAGAIGRIVSDNENAVNFLATCLREEKDGGVRECAAQELGLLRWNTEQAVQPLADALEDHYREVRVTAAVSLGQIAPAASDAIPALAKAIESKMITREAAVTLGKFGLAAKETVPALSTLLYHKDRIERSVAAHALGRIGPDAKDTLPRLLELLGKGKDVEEYATAVANIDLYAEGVVPALIQAMNTPNKTQQEKIAVLLSKDDERILSQLAEALANNNAKDRWMRKGVILTLIEIGNPAVPTLKGALEHEDLSTRLRVSDALQIIETRKGRKKN